jgi:hypothetical protein
MTLRILIARTWISLVITVLLALFTIYAIQYPLILIPVGVFIVIVITTWAVANVH